MVQHEQVSGPKDIVADQDGRSPHEEYRFVSKEDPVHNFGLL